MKNNLQRSNRSPVLGVPMELPKNKDKEISEILRVILAISDNDDTDSMISEGEPYEVLVRRLSSYKQNISDVAQRIREVTNYA